MRALSELLEESHEKFKIVSPTHATRIPTIGTLLVSLIFIKHKNNIIRRN